MALYGLAQRTTSSTIATAAQEIRSTSANKPRMLEYGLSQVSAGAATYGIGRPTAIGVSPTGPVTFVDEGDGNAPAAQTTACVAWGTGPQAPTFFNRRFNSNSTTVGAGVIFIFPRGMAIPLSSSIVLWNISGASSLYCDVYAVVDE
jgi:hypothetical protein